MTKKVEPLYVLVDAEHTNENPVYGVFTRYEYAVKSMERLIEEMIKECLAVDPKESGIDPETDLLWLANDIRNSLKIDTLPQGIDKLLF